MSSYTSISVEALARTVGTGNAPVLVECDSAFADDPRLIPGSSRREPSRVAVWSNELAGKQVVCICRQGDSLSQGASARLRHEGVEAAYLAGGFEAWRDAGQPLARTQPIPQRNSDGRTVWVTRERPKIDRIACPWLIRRFIDPGAVFLFVAAPQVPVVAERFGATHSTSSEFFESSRETCTFDTMLTEFGLQSTALDRLATIVRGADTARPELAPQAPGLLAISLGLSQLIDDDLNQLEAGLPIYDALYLWCRDASEETHNWPSKSVGGTR